MDQNAAASRYRNGWMTSSKPARPRSGARPDSRPPITLIADPQSTKRTERLRFGCLCRGEVQTACFLGQCLQQVALALPAPPADDAERGLPGGIGGERRESLPFPFPAEHPAWFCRFHAANTSRSLLL